MICRLLLPAIFSVAGASLAHAAAPDLTASEQAVVQAVIASQCRDQLGDGEVFEFYMSKAEGLARDLPDGSDLGKLRSPGSGASQDGTVNPFLRLMCNGLREEMTGATARP